MARKFFVVAALISLILVALAAPGLADIVLPGDDGTGRPWLENNGGNSGEQQQVNSVATPIPGAVWLLGTGLLGLVCVRRRRKS